LIEQVRIYEKKFGDLDVTLVRKRTLPAGRGQPKSAKKILVLPAFQENRVIHIVVQGTNAYSKLSLTRKLGAFPADNLEWITTFDGTKSRTVERGGSINVHDGRSLLLQAFRPHALPLQIDIPLSAFLAGTQSEVKSFKFALGFIDEPPGRPQKAIGPKIIGEETIKGLACIRLEYDQETSENDPRSHVRLWLAKDRNLIPAKCLVFASADASQPAIGESRVEDWQSIDGEVWVPKRIVFATYKVTSKARSLMSNETLVLEKFDSHSHQSPDFFQKINASQGLPLFTIQNGRLADSFPPRKTPPDAQGKLQQLAGDLRTEENRYDHLTVDATESRTTFPLSGSQARLRRTKLHSLLSGEMAFTDAMHETWRADKSYRPMLWTEGFDGTMYRSWGRHPPPRLTGYAQVSASNFFDGTSVQCPALLRPHCAFVPWRSSYHRLSDELWPSHEPASKANDRVQFLGEDRRGPFNCIVLAIKPVGVNRLNLKSLIWLATERNLIPVRCESYQATDSLPYEISEIDNFSEVAPKVWYPSHFFRYVFRRRVSPSMQDGFLFLEQFWDYKVRSVELKAPTSPNDYGQIVVPEGTLVQYYDKTGRLFTKIAQSSSSVPMMPAAK